MKDRRSSKKESRQPSLKDVLKAVVSDLLAAPLALCVGIYLKHLERTVKKWKRLPRGFRKTFKGLYPGLKLRRIRFSEGSFLFGRYAVTFGNTIFFPHRINLAKREHKHYMLHELTHCLQYAQTEDTLQFLIRYIQQMVACMLEHRTLFVHDKIPFEIEAEAKADEGLEMLTKRYF